jgi:hypothetical protein
VKLVRLIGTPRLIDVAASTTLDAQKEIDVWLVPKVKPVDEKATKNGPVAAKAKAAPATGEAFQIKNLIALEDVHLKTPGKLMTARKRLDALFDSPPEPSTPKPAQPGTAQPPTAVAANGGGNPPNGEKGTEPAKENVKPAEPAVDVKADRVYTRILLKNAPEAAGGAQPAEAPGGPEAGRGEVQLALLRGKVLFHQDPEPGKTKGTDVIGEAIDLANQGKGKMEIKVDYRVDPKANLDKAALALLPHARVSNEEMTITGPTIGLNQLKDVAWVDGPGTLRQMAERGLFTDKGLAEPKSDNGDQARRAPDTTKRPMTISWKTRMRFMGQSHDPSGRPAAQANFYGSVNAVTDTAQLVCKDRMETYMDRTVALTRPPKREGEAKPEEEEPKPQIALIRCYEDVIVVASKRDPKSNVLLQQQRIEGKEVTYDKRTGNFHVPGAGIVYLWNRNEKGKGPTTGQTLTPTQHTVATTSSAPNARRPAADARRNADQKQASRGKPTAKDKDKGKGKGELPPLELTMITFSKEMKGRYLAGEDADTTATRWADFNGDVQALNAKVKNERVYFDFDRRPDDGMLLTSQSLRVVSEPTPGEASPA